MIICGIETSCDDTSISFVKDGKIILSNITFSQYQSHNLFSGVVPEIASREHLNNIDKTYKIALNEAKIEEKDIDLISVSAFPGLIGSLVVGVNFAKGLAFRLKKPLIGVNHLLAHIYAVNFSKKIDFPILALLISGGHTAILKMDNFLEFEIIGKTYDDSVGEAFDKIAKHFELGYPGGPIIDKLSIYGNPTSYVFPITSHEEKHKLNFSFSGLKTAVIYFREKYISANINNNLNFEFKNYSKDNKPNLDLNKPKELLKTFNKDYFVHQEYLKKKNILKINENLFDILSSFQYTIAKIISFKLNQALSLYSSKYKSIVVAGGASANSQIRKELYNLSKLNNINIIFPELSLCTDNGAMIAGLALEYYKNNILSDLYLSPNARFQPLKRGC
ncbi:MAG: tRNA (adenosine(37)-N6)-threonylcarbamoyltransferase complex transferase subunit TsaD [Spirochaetes bacterium]|nr:tRNA (adenosine(37)-N6)-threonylcarbamoyltransferase complex transferase subunit TsaD [Spirochaetota bacterium]